MLIRCAACNKLIYTDDALKDEECPACGSTNTEQIAMGFIFDQGVDVPVKPGMALERGDRPDLLHRKP
ncbi:hypothetical protein AWB79_02230 [Caballeronia hypogeia]|uniref:Uncharacterized protein n=1 Tax=Caballeronia hypogeia TaxID=1777140 RepID=A0A158ADR8_9BURK|nr:hypothetical protein [Caballeronia hypogeia]SAK55859.1 hypothetical protein AWB79_02230 [Caballeronia hypogeia]